MALSMDKKLEFRGFLRMLANTLVAGLVAILSSCGTSPGYNYTVGGSVSGMIGSGLVLQNNLGDDRIISANEAFSFKTPLTSGTAYNVTVKTQPTNPSQFCTVSNASGTVNSGPAVNVIVDCMSSPISVAVDPTWKFAYTANMNGSGSSYTIDSGSGALNPLGSPFLIGTLLSSVTIDPQERGFVYVTDVGDGTGNGKGTISAYQIDQTIGSPTIGELTPICGSTGLACPSTGKFPASITIDPSGEFAYVTNTVDNTISAYGIDFSTGALTELISLGSPFPISTLATSPVSIVTTVLSGSSSEVAYVANMNSNNISAYSINSNGSLTELNTLSAGTNPKSVTVDPSRKFVYAANEGSLQYISAYSINPNGSLAAASGSSVAHNGTTSIVTVQVGSSEFAYATNTVDSTISIYRIDLTTGALTELTALGIGSPFPTGTGTYPSSITINSNPSGPFAYVVNAGDGSVSSYKIETTGALTLQ